MIWMFLFFVIITAGLSMCCISYMMMRWMLIRFRQSFVTTGEYGMLLEEVETEIKMWMLFCILGVLASIATCPYMPWY